MNLGMEDMKAEKLISGGKVGGRMAELLRSSREGGHETLLDAADRYLAKREASRGKYVSKGTEAPMDWEMFRQIYSTVLDSYKRTGDAASAGLRHDHSHDIRLGNR